MPAGVERSSTRKTTTTTPFDSHLNVERCNSDCHTVNWTLEQFIEYINRISLACSFTVQDANSVSNQAKENFEIDVIAKLRVSGHATPFINQVLMHPVPRKLQQHQDNQKVATHSNEFKVCVPFENKYSAKADCLSKENDVGIPLQSKYLPKTECSSRMNPIMDAVDGLRLLLSDDSKCVQKENTSDIVWSTADSTSSRGQRKRHEHEPGKNIYVHPTDSDVLLGRGGRSNHHPGNQRYLDAKNEIQPRYMAATKDEKTSISQDLVNTVRSWGGRFLKQDPSCDSWYEVPNIVARKKASQTLREINTAEMRAAKRARYQSNI